MRKLIRITCFITFIAVSVPGLVLCYISIFGGHVTDDQWNSAAAMLFIGSFLSGLIALFTAEFQS